MIGAEGAVATVSGAEVAPPNSAVLGPAQATKPVARKNHTGWVGQGRKRTYIRRT